MMRTIKQTGLPTSGAHWSYGPDFMRQISKASAKKLLAPDELPKIGYELTAEIKDGFYLQVHNICGDYFLASTSVRVADWPEWFNVTIVE